MLSKAVGQPLRSAKNALSNNVVSRTLLGDNTFTALLPEDKKELQDLTKNLNDIMTNIDFAIDKDGKQAEEDVKTLITNNESVYEIIEHILEQPKIQQHIANKIGKGKRMSEILQHMYQDILTKSGANPKVSELVSNILTYNMDYGNELKQDDKPINLNEITLDLGSDNIPVSPSPAVTPSPPPIVTNTQPTMNPTKDLSPYNLQLQENTPPTTKTPIDFNRKPNTKTPIPRDPYIDFNNLPPLDPNNMGDQRNW